MQWTHEHLEIQKTLKRFIDAEINPHVDEWEAAEMFPAHEVFKKLGNLGLLGLTKPEAHGGAAQQIFNRRRQNAECDRKQGADRDKQSFGQRQQSLHQDQGGGGLTIADRVVPFQQPGFDRLPAQRAKRHHDVHGLADHVHQPQMPQPYTTRGALREG